MAHEKDCARLERVIHRLWILCFIMFLTLAITNYMWWRYESQWEVVEETTEQTVTQDVDTGRFGDAVVAGIGDIHILRDHYCDGMTYEELADIHNLHVNTIKHIIYKNEWKILKHLNLQA